MSMPQWTITVPVEKSEHDGGRYLVGIAAGPGVDAQNDLVTPAAIERFSERISQRPIPLRNFHKTDDITADLGEVTKAWITNDGELGVEILLDEDNKDSDFIWKKIEKGKQFGLSIHGNAINPSYKYDPASAKRVRVLDDVDLDEISITTRPAFTPSFGTVVRKSIEDAEGEDTLSKEQVESSVEEIVEDSSTVAKTETPVVETSTPDVPEAPVVSEDVAVEKAVQTSDSEAKKKFATFIAKIVSEADSLGLLSEEAEVPASASEVDTTVIEHSVAAEGSETEVIKSLQDEITELKAWKESIMEQIPSTQLPPAQVEKSKSEDLTALLSQMTPTERISFGLQLAEQGR